MNQIIFLFPDIPTVVSLPSLLPHGSSLLLRLPMAMAEACHKRVAEGRPHRYLLEHGEILPQRHLGTLLCPWESQLHCQPQWLMAIVSKAALPLAPGCGSPTTPAADGAI